MNGPLDFFKQPQRDYGGGLVEVRKLNAEANRLRDLLKRARLIVDMVARTDDDPEPRKLCDEIDAALSPNAEMRGRPLLGDPSRLTGYAPFFDGNIF